MMRATAAVASGALLAALSGVLVASPARADTTQRGACGPGTYELEAERDDGRIEVSADLDRLAPGSRWVVVLKHDGKRYAKVTRTADVEGDIDLDHGRPDTAGRDTFRLKATPVGGGAGCRATVTVG